MLPWKKTDTTIALGMGKPSVEAVTYGSTTSYGFQKRTTKHNMRTETPIRLLQVPVSSRVAMMSPPLARLANKHNWWTVEALHGCFDGVTTAKLSAKNAIYQRSRETKQSGHRISIPHQLQLLLSATDAFEVQVESSKTFLLPNSTTIQMRMRTCVTRFQRKLKSRTKKHRLDFRRHYAENISSPLIALVVGKIIQSK